jgi:hypothetical protein
MARYQVSIIERPEDWVPASPDDVPPEPGAVLDALAETDGLFPAVRLAIDHNRSPDRQKDRRWAVVIEPGRPGPTWPSARICTPVAYKVASIWWPTGWEPDSPLDVPNCVWLEESGTGHGPMPYRRALATVRALNRQSMDHAATTWYVLVAVENEPVSERAAYDASGTETTVAVRRLHVVRPERGGKGDCSHCPAHSLDCVNEDWNWLEQSATETGP